MEYINTRKEIFLKSLFCPLKWPFLGGNQRFCQFTFLSNWSKSVWNEKREKLELNKYERAPYFFSIKPKRNKNMNMRNSSPFWQDQSGFSETSFVRETDGKLKNMDLPHIYLAVLQKVTENEAS